MLLPKDQRSGHVTSLKSYFSHANALSFKIRKLHCHEHEQVTMLLYLNIGAWKLTVGLLTKGPYILTKGPSDNKADPCDA